MLRDRDVAVLRKGEEYMKPVKLMLVLLVVVLTCNSCAMTQWMEDNKRRKVQDREIYAELSTYSDVLDISRSKINYPEVYYYFIFNSSAPIFSFKLSLYLKPDSDNRQAVITVRDGLVNFFSDSEGKPIRNIMIDFISGENGETKIIYKLSPSPSSEKPVSFHGWRC